MWSDKVEKCIFKLGEIYKARKNYLNVSYPIIEIIRHEKGYDKRDKKISLKLYYFDSTEKFEMQPPDAVYLPTISYYNYRAVERRWTRNRDFIFSLIRDLQKCGLWNLVSNKDLIVLNTYNPRATDKKGELMGALSDLKRAGSK